MAARTRTPRAFFELLGAGSSTLKSPGEERRGFERLDGRSGAPGQTNVFGSRTGVDKSSSSLSLSALPEPDDWTVTETGDAGSIGSIRPAASVSNASDSSGAPKLGMESGLSTKDDGRDMNEDTGRMFKVCVFANRVCQCRNKTSILFF